MKTVKTSILSLLATILLFSCQKEDIQEVPATEVRTEAAVEEKVQWSTYAEWNEMKQEHFSVSYTVIADSSITASVAENGLVLVYKKDDASNASIQLPFEDKKGNNTNYWYFQVFEGQILISCDVYGSANDAVQNTPFIYLTIEEAMLRKLETNGYTKEKLVNMSYSNIKNVMEQL